jgi:two-component system sensor histidine kinase BaeS
MSIRKNQSGSRDCAARVERAMVEAGARLEDLIAATGELRRAELGAIAAAAVAHEVRNLLTPVRARLELALLGLGDAALVERSLREALKGLEQAGRAAEAVLSVVGGRVEIGDGADVAEATRAAAGWAGGAGFVVEVVGGARVTMSQVAMEQVMMNLLLNARVAAGGRGKVVVRIVVETNTKSASRESRIASGEDGTGRSVVIEVEDRGAGMVGGLFGTGEYENGEARTAATGATRGGIGLVVCRHLVEAVGGSISARSQVGVGTTVRLELPAAAGAKLSDGMDKAA